MDLQQKWVWLLCGAVLCFSIVAWFKSGRPLRAMLLSADNRARIGEGIAAGVAAYLNAG